jgi:hypothetical protein
MVNVSPYTRRRIENVAYTRAADLAKSYAEHWEHQARQTTRANSRQTDDDYWDAKTKAGHWRIIEKAIRKLAAEAADEQKPVTGAAVHEFIERGRRAQATVNCILDEHARRPAKRERRSCPPPNNAGRRFS